MNDKIVLINQSSGYLMIDIANAFAGSFPRVALIAGSVGPHGTPLDPRIRVSRIWRYHRGSFAAKGISWIVAAAQIAFLLSFKYRGYDVFCTTNPPIACLLSLFTGNRFTLLVYDIYPDALRMAGIGEKNIIYRFWAVLNKKVFARARKIFVLSGDMAKTLGQYTKPGQCMVISNWADPGWFRPMEKQSNDFIAKNNLSGRFIIFHSGNIGYAHNVGVLMDLARRCEALDKNILLLFTGGGEGAKKIKNYGLANISVLPYQPASEVPGLLAAADMAVISLNEQAARVSFPSRLYSLMASGTPLLCIAPRDSELNEIVTRYDNGACFEETEMDKALRFIDKVRLDRGLRDRYAENSRKASFHFTPANARLYVEEHLKAS